MSVASASRCIINNLLLFWGCLDVLQPVPAAKQNWRRAEHQLCYTAEKQVRAKLTGQSVRHADEITADLDAALHIPERLLCRTAIERQASSWVARRVLGNSGNSARLRNCRRGWDRARVCAGVVVLVDHGVALRYCRWFARLRWKLRRRNVCCVCVCVREREKVKRRKIGCVLIRRNIVCAIYPLAPHIYKTACVH